MCDEAVGVPALIDATLRRFATTREVGRCAQLIG